MTHWVVITGATSGIGKALALHFAKENYHVLALGRNTSALTKLQNMSKNIKAVNVDLLTKDAITKIKKSFLQNDKLQFLIHCAVSAEPFVGLSDLTLNDFNNIMQLNTYIPFYLTTQLSKFFNEKTRVLFINSDYAPPEGKFHCNISGAYAISKAALAKAIQYLRAERPELLIAEFNPGSTHTPLLEKIYDKIAHQPHFFKKNKTNIATPEEVAFSIFILLTQTDDSTYSMKNGDHLNMDKFISHGLDKTYLNKKCPQLTLQAKL